MIESGQQFGLYVIKDVVSASSTETCCCAEDPFFNREVALKIYSEEQFLEGDRLEQLESLLERLSVLDHPSITPIYDSGLEEGYFYYTSSCYRGKTLAQVLAAPMPEEQALRVAAELSKALDYALGQQLGQGELNAEKIFFDSDGRAVMADFGIDLGIKQIHTSGHQTAADLDQQGFSGSVAETLHSIGDLLLHMLLGPDYNNAERIDDQVAKIDNSKIRRLVGRFLLPGEWRFSSFAELLEELVCFNEIADLLSVDEPARIDESHAQAEKNDTAEEQSDKMVTEVRRLVAEKNNLQQELDKALYERNVAGNKQVEGERRLVQAKEEIVKAREEADVAWELVAGQKYDRWRPATWAVGGFVIGFLLSGSYGYYYSEQTRDELLAKLQANEELIKSAAWRPAEQSIKQEPIVTAAQPTAASPLVAKGSVANEVEDVAQATTTPIAATEADPDQKLVAGLLRPVVEEPKLWWPAGNEFSVTAAIPIEQIKAALGIEGKVLQKDLPEVLRREVLTTVRSWADSWAKQDLSNYFSFYSDSYRPELGRSLHEWREMRSSRLNRPQWIELDIDDIQVRKIGEDRMQVKLKQSYRSDFYQDEILKSINLIKEDGQWRILMERSLGMIGHSDIVGG